MFKKGDLVEIDSKIEGWEQIGIVIEVTNLWINCKWLDDTFDNVGGITENQLKPVNPIQAARLRKDGTIKKILEKINEKR